MSSSVWIIVRMKIKKRCSNIDGFDDRHPCSGQFGLFVRVEMIANKMESDGSILISH